MANYEISVTLDPESKILSGRQTLRWQNSSPDTIRELRFHLYLNAFKSARSTFMQESGGRHRGFTHRAETPGWIRIDSIETGDRFSIAAGMEFIRPDDNNKHDSTVIQVRLHRPLLPGHSIRLFIAFTAQLPSVSARTGYHEDFFMVGQWFPKIGVYEPAPGRDQSSGSWNCHQFHANTEFYADFGVYDVEITVPDRYTVGATGTSGSERYNGDGTKTIFYHAEDVHDFAWTASPRFVEVTDIWRHVNIRLLMQPQRAHLADRYLVPVRHALEYFASHLEPYPYPQLTIVDPPFGGGGAGGMEYPTLITTGMVRGIGTTVRWPEQVTVHEFAHQYWYGMVANNEFEEEWLDEGLTEYYECRIMDDVYGEKSSSHEILGVRSGTLEGSRLSYTGLRDPSFAPIVTPTWQIQERGIHRLTYSKATTVLATLERMIGREAMDSALFVYFQRWKFRHPRTSDFVAVFNEVVPAIHGNRFKVDLDWYFDQFLYGTETCDFELSSLSSTPIGEGETKRFESTVAVRQLRDARIPVKVHVGFENGEELVELWDGQSATTSYTYWRPDRAVWAEIDPDRKILLDMNFINNSKTLSPPSWPLWKYTTWMLFLIQNLLQSLAFAG
ncbi:MAG: M1 family metallopeptidase [Bacteroidota bacterium]